MLSVAICPGLTFLINNVETKSVSVFLNGSRYVVNGTQLFDRIKLNENHFKDEDWQLNKVTPVGFAEKFHGGGLPGVPHYPFGWGKYVVRYHGLEYYMTYFDELELFRTVVVRQYAPFQPQS